MIHAPFSISCILIFFCCCCVEFNYGTMLCVPPKNEPRSAPILKPNNSCAKKCRPPCCRICYVLPSLRCYVCPPLAGDTKWAHDNVAAVARDYILERMVFVHGCLIGTDEALLWENFPTKLLFFF